MSEARRRVVGILIICLLVFASGTWAQETAPAAETNGEPLLSRSVGTFPRIGSYEVLRGDFHIHTPHSDGKVPPRERILEAWRYDYDVIAITDHGSYKAYAEALPLARSLGLLLVRGLETGIAGKEHYVVLGITDDYQPRDPHRWSEQPDGETAYYRPQLRHVADSGGLALYAHPHVGFREPTEWGIAQGIIQGIEVKNAVVGSGWETIESHGTWCYPNAFDWALEHDLTIFANSDIHAPRRGDNQPVTLVLVGERSVQGVMDAIRARRTVAWFDGMLWGREGLLTDLVQGMTRVRRTEDGSGSLQLRIANHSPVALRATLQVEGDPRRIEVPPYSEALSEWTDLPELLSVRWDNVWINPRENLVTRHNLRTGS